MGMLTGTLLQMTILFFIIMRTKWEAQVPYLINESLFVYMEISCIWINEGRLLQAILAEKRISELGETTAND
jgi:hypothetical protein